MDLGHDKFPWAFFTLIAVAGTVALIRHWLLSRWMGTPELPAGTPRRGFEVIQRPGNQAHKRKGK
jgi:hypothetical protein